MFKINFNKYAQLLNWSVIYWGIKKDFIDANSAIEYANQLIENSSKDDSLIIELLIIENKDKETVLTLIERFVPRNILPEEEALVILRYVFLENIMQSNQSIQEILNHIEDVYVDFDYPADMNSFIRYMPVKESEYNPNNHSQEENEQRLFEIFCNFLEKEKEKIKQ